MAKFYSVVFAIMEAITISASLVFNLLGRAQQQGVRLKQ
jgi:hypothetical protein